jgi:UPF0755 protein
LKDRIHKHYTYKTLIEERKYGIFWYSWAWSVIRPVLIGICALLIVGGTAAIGWDAAYRSFFMPVDSGDLTNITFKVDNGSSLTRVANSLQEQRLIRNRSVFKYFSDFLGYGQKIRAGEYSLNRGMSMQEIAEKLTAGDGKPLTRVITIIPGWTCEDIAAKLAEDKVIASEQEFLTLCKTGAEFGDYYYIADAASLDRAQQRRNLLEGYLAPDTYEIYTSATPGDIIRKLLSQTEGVFTAPFHERAEELGFTMDQVITLASMIEKEAKSADFAKVSAVFHNRLRKNMKLESDVTVKYASGVRRMALTKGDLAFNSPYNTYRQKGLPIGPICNPGPGAILAALYPDETFLEENYLYFCSKDPNTGELFFSKTLEEHNNAVKIFGPLWQAFDEKTGAN